MTVYNKIRFAEYFLNKMKDAREKEDFDPNLNAFLLIAKSVLDNLLWDYNKKFELGLKLEDYVDAKNFKIRVCDKMNLDALKFISSYDKKFKKLKQDKIIKWLINQRNITAHKKSISSRRHVSVSIIENVNKNTTHTNTSFYWGFDDEDYKNVDAVKSCEKFLRLMKQFVDDLKADFP